MKTISKLVFMYKMYNCSLPVLVKSVKSQQIKQQGKKESGQVESSKPAWRSEVGELPIFEPFDINSNSEDNALSDDMRPKAKCTTMAMKQSVPSGSRMKSKNVPWRAKSEKQSASASNEHFLDNKTEAKRFGFAKLHHKPSNYYKTRDSEGYIQAIKESQKDLKDSYFVQSPGPMFAVLGLGKDIEVSSENESTIYSHDLESQSSRIQKRRRKTKRTSSRSKYKAHSKQRARSVDSRSRYSTDSEDDVDGSEIMSDTEYRKPNHRNRPRKKQGSTRRHSSLNDTHNKNGTRSQYYDTKDASYDEFQDRSETLVNSAAKSNTLHECKHQVVQKERRPTSVGHSLSIESDKTPISKYQSERIPNRGITITNRKDEQESKLGLSTPNRHTTASTPVHGRNNGAKESQEEVSVLNS